MPIQQYWQHNQMPKQLLCMLANGKERSWISEGMVGQDREHTEEDTLPPIQHVQPKRDIVKVDLPLYPIHGYRKPTSKKQPPSQNQSKISGSCKPWKYGEWQFDNQTSKSTGFIDPEGPYIWRVNLSKHKSVGRGVQ